MGSWNTFLSLLYTLFILTCIDKLEARLTVHDFNFDAVERWRVRNTVCRHMCGASGCVNWSVSGLDRDRCICNGCGAFYDKEAQYCIDKNFKLCDGTDFNMTTELSKPEAMRFTHAGCELRVSGTSEIHVHPTCSLGVQTFECSACA